MSSVKSRRTQYSEATRAALVEAAMELFVEKGFAGTTLGDVAVAARVTRGAVYHHFADKKALFEAVLGELEEETVRDVAEAASGTSTAFDAADAALVAFLDRCSDPIYGKLVWQEGPVALGWARWRECEDTYAYGITEQLIRALRDAGEVVDLHVPRIARFAFAMLGAAGQELADGDETDKSRIKNECLELIRRFMVGLRSVSSDPALDHQA